MTNNNMNTIARKVLAVMYEDCNNHRDSVERYVDGYFNIACEIRDLASELHLVSEEAEEHFNYVEDLLNAIMKEAKGGYLYDLEEDYYKTLQEEEEEYTIN